MMAASVDFWEEDSSFLGDEGLLTVSGDSSWSPHVSDSCAALMLQASSALAQPLIKAHEFYRRMQVAEALNPQVGLVKYCAEQFFLGLGFAAFGLAAAITTLPAIALRFIAISLQEKDFLHFRGNLEEKIFQNNLFSLLSWNICFMPGGYAITSGGVAPWSFRIDSVTDKIKTADADVVCLYEVFEMDAATALFEKLKDNYAHFYFNMGPRKVGLSSGIFVASKYKIEECEFTYFPQEIQVGGAKNCNKGFFSFNLESEESPFAHIIATHLQSSEECGNPSEEEQTARKNEMAIILEKIDRARERKVLLTGDLNMDDIEYENSSWSRRFEQGALNYQNRTWGGDGFCANLVGNRSSSASNLDHTLSLRDGIEHLETTLIETDFDPDHYNLEALSDHAGLYSLIRV